MSIHSKVSDLSAQRQIGIEIPKEIIVVPFCSTKRRQIYQHVWWAYNNYNQKQCLKPAENLLWRMGVKRSMCKICAKFVYAKFVQCKYILLYNKINTNSKMLTLIFTKLGSKFKKKENATKFIKSNPQKLRCLRKRKSRKHKWKRHADKYKFDFDYSPFQCN